MPGGVSIKNFVLRSLETFSVGVSSDTESANSSRLPGTIFPPLSYLFPISWFNSSFVLQRQSINIPTIEATYRGRPSSIAVSVTFLSFLGKAPFVFCCSCLLVGVLDTKNDAPQMVFWNECRELHLGGWLSQSIIFAVLNLAQNGSGRNGPAQGFRWKRLHRLPTL